MSTGGGYSIWTNEERTVYVRIWDSGVIEVAFRDSQDDVWGPPIKMTRSERDEAGS